MISLRLNLFALKHFRCAIRKPIFTKFALTHQFRNESGGKVLGNAEGVLSQALSCNNSDVNRMLKNTPELRKHGPAKLAERIVFLKVSGILNTSIIKHPFLIAEPADELQQRLDILQSLQIEDADNYVALFRINMKEFRLVQKAWLSDIDVYKKNRMVYISEKLNIELKMVCERFSKTAPYLLRKPVESLIKTLTILENHNFDSMEILRNLKVFMHSNEAITARLNKMTSMKIEPRLWMTYCKQMELDNYIANNLAERVAQGEHKNRICFFKEKLDLDDDDVQLMFRHNPRLQICKLRRVTVIIDYLLNETNYVAEDIRNVPTIFKLSLETIKKRLTYFERIGKTGIPLSYVIKISNAEVAKVLGKDEHTRLDEH